MLNDDQLIIEVVVTQSHDENGILVNKSKTFTYPIKMSDMLLYSFPLSMVKDLVLQTFYLPDGSRVTPRDINSAGVDFFADVQKHISLLTVNDTWNMLRTPYCGKLKTKEGVVFGRASCMLKR